MKTSILVTSVGAGLGTLGGGGLLVQHLLKKETVTVGNKLTEKGHKFLDFEKDKDLNDWKVIAKAYSTSKKNRLGSLTITIPNSGKQEATNEHAESLKKACQIAINDKDYTKENLKVAEQWCVKPITIKDLISKHRKILNSETSKNLEESAWITKVDDYLRPEVKNKLPEPTLKVATPDNKKADIDKLKAECNKLVEKKTHDVDFHENYASFNDWCTVAKEGSIS